MYKVDKVITKYSGSANYMDQLARITGHLNSINEEYYNNAVNTLKLHYKTIKTLFSKPEFSCSTMNNLLNDLDLKYNQLNLDVLYEDITKKSKKSTKPTKVIHKIKVTPKNIYESQWYTLMKQIDKRVLTILEQFNVKDDNIDEVLKQMETMDMYIIETYKFYTVSVNNITVLRSLSVAYKLFNKINEIILHPMYDLKSTIEKNWMPEIDKTLGLDLMKKNDSVTPMNVQEYIYTFVLTKYRLELTGNTTEFTKTILNTIDITTMKDVNPTTFIHLIDGIQVDSLKNKAGVKKIIDVVKGEFIKLSENKNISTIDILEDINNILEDKIEETKESQIEPDTVFE